MSSLYDAIKRWWFGDEINSIFCSCVLRNLFSFWRGSLIRLMVLHVFGHPSSALVKREAVFHILTTTQRWGWWHPQEQRPRFLRCSYWRDEMLRGRDALKRRIKETHWRDTLLRRIGETHWRDALETRQRVAVGGAGFTVLHCLGGSWGHFLDGDDFSEDVDGDVDVYDYVMQESLQSLRSLESLKSL